MEVLSKRVTGYLSKVSRLLRPTRHVPEVSTRAFLLTSFVLSAGLVLFSPPSWPLWATATLGLIPWMPPLVLGARWNYRRYQWHALFYVLLVTQTGHFLEHVAQMIQIHLLGLQGVDAGTDRTCLYPDDLSKYGPGRYAGAASPRGIDRRWTAHFPARLALPLQPD